MSRPVETHPLATKLTLVVADNYGTLSVGVFCCRGKALDRPPMDSVYECKGCGSVYKRADVLAWLKTE